MRFGRERVGECGDVEVIGSDHPEVSAKFLFGTADPAAAMGPDDGRKRSAAVGDLCRRVDVKPRVRMVAVALVGHHAHVSRRPGVESCKLHRCPGEERANQERHRSRADQKGLLEPPQLHPPTPRKP
jgi:hypothetical protein